MYECMVSIYRHEDVPLKTKRHFNPSLTKKSVTF